MKISLNLIRPNPEQPRRQFDAEALETLALNIHRNGLVQAVTVEEADEEQQYILHDGERRWRACCVLAIADAMGAGPDNELSNNELFGTWIDLVAHPNWPHQMSDYSIILDDEQYAIPAYVVERRSDGDEWSDLLIRAIAANEQRANLNPIELAISYQHLSDAGMTDVEIGRRIGKGKSAINNLRRLLRLPEEVQQFIAEGQLTARAGRELLRITGHERAIEFCLSAAKEAVEGHYTTSRIVDAVDRRVRDVKALNRIETRYCYYCNMPRKFNGLELQEFKKFSCNHCGRDIERYYWEKEQRQCADCGSSGELIRSQTGDHRIVRRCPTCHINARVSRFCPVCGDEISLHPEQAEKEDFNERICARCGHSNQRWLRRPLPELPGEPVPARGRLDQHPGYISCAICGNAFKGEGALGIELEAEIQYICPACEARLRMEELMIEPEEGLQPADPPSIDLAPLRASLMRRWEALLQNMDENGLDVLSEHLSAIEQQINQE